MSHSGLLVCFIQSTTKVRAIAQARITIATTSMPNECFRRGHTRPPDLSQTLGVKLLRQSHLPVTQKAAPRSADSLRGASTGFGRTVLPRSTSVLVVCGEPLVIPASSGAPVALDGLAHAPRRPAVAAYRLEPTTSLMSDVVGQGPFMFSVPYT
jgi:hypothetical protein